MPVARSENESLLAQLRSQRRHVLGILDGLDEEALRRTVLPSGWNCLGLVHHLALDDERFWFRGVVMGEQQVIDWVGSEPDDAWRLGPEIATDEVFSLYRREAALADEVLAAADLDAAPAWWPEELFGDFRLHSVRDVVLHVLTETATHAGHLDAARELIDGRTWLVVE